VCTEHSRADDTTNTAEADESGRAKSALPLSSNVVCLPGESAGHVGVGSSCSKEDTEIADADVLGKPEEWQADESEDTIGDDPDRANVVFVTGPCESVHDDCGKDVGWCNQALSLAGAESHAVLENDGQEVCDGVGDGGGTHEDDGEAPDLQVNGVGHVLFEVELFWDGIMSIFLNSGYDKGGFLLVKEVGTKKALLGSKFWEVDDEIPSDEANDNCDDTLENENPSPA